MSEFLPTHQPEHQHHRLREALAILTGVAAGFGVLGIAVALIGTISPARATGLWIGSGILLALALTGGIWRYDAPDRRTRQQERERRGF